MRTNSLELCSRNPSLVLLEAERKGNLFRLRVPGLTCTPHPTHHLPVHRPSQLSITLRAFSTLEAQSLVGATGMRLLQDPLTVAAIPRSPYHIHLPLTHLLNLDIQLKEIFITKAADIVDFLPLLTPATLEDVQAPFLVDNTITVTNTITITIHMDSSPQMVDAVKGAILISPVGTTSPFLTISG